jgi:hypothetical protein
VSGDAFRFRLFMVVCVLAVLVWVGFVGAVVLNSAAPPPAKVAPRPPPVFATLPAAPDSAGQTIETGRLSDVESTPLIADAPPDASDQAVPPLVSTTSPAPQRVPPPPIHKPAGKYDAGSTSPAPKHVAALPPPPPKLVNVTVRTFHPPVISAFYKDMVADKMREEGIDPRLEAKVRSGRQLTKEDLASVPKPVMEKMNAQVVAYGQPPLYTDTTMTVAASAER